MSLGFLTESALLPSKAKAIKVDSKSLVDLRAVVFQKEQERQERKRKLLDAAASGHDDDEDEANSARTDAAAPSGARGFGRFAHLKATKKRGGRSGSQALSRDEDKLGRASNRGVEKRRRQDDTAHALEVRDDDDKAWHDKSRAMLAKKAELYDAMVSGRALESTSASAAAVTECLVDFRAKQQQQQPHTGASESARVEITDEFGRTRTVAADSAAYAEYLERQAAAERPAPAAAGAASSSSSSSTADVRAERDGSSTMGSSSSSYVTSQWEKRLNAQEKTYLQQVHASVGLAKSALPTDSKTRKQRRLAMLRQQQQSDSSSADPVAVAAPLATQDEHAATAQATAFLHALL